MLSCLDTCKLNQRNLTLESLLLDNLFDTTIAKIPNRPFRLEYAPVGNFPENPAVIICGKTPDYKTWNRFLYLYRAGCRAEQSAYQSIYSNMKNNLYQYLEIVGLFDYLEKVNTYWAGEDKKRLWNLIFTDEISSKACGIQLTQACNCAILNGNSSKEPSKTIFKHIHNNCPDCFFRNFNINPNLRLIIFLDTPSQDGRFHQIDYWDFSEAKKKADEVGAKVISITHPSSQNNKIFKQLKNFELCDFYDTKLKNAKFLYQTAKHTIKYL